MSNRKAKHSLDSFNTQITNYKIEDLQKKIDIAGNVLKQCHYESNFDDKKSSDLQSFLEKCSRLTGVDTETLSALNFLEQKTINFGKWFTEQKQMLHDYNYEYSRLKKQLIERYTKKIEIPTGVKENKEFEGYQKNFTLLQLPGTTSSIIVEKAETVQERHRFLHAKMMYREEKKHIVYIGKINLLLDDGKFSYKEDSVDLKNRFIIVASPTLGHLGYIYCCGKTKEFLMSWIEEKIIPELPKETVIIFQENVINSTSEINTLTSKEDMINWLKCNKINHDPKMHRADLFKLIKDFKCPEQLSTVEGLLRAHGHITIRKKRCHLKNNYLDPFWEFLRCELNRKSQSVPEMKYGLMNHTHGVTSAVNTIVRSIKFDYWENLENILLEKELEVYEEDLEMENMIDKCVTMVKYQDLPEHVKLDEYTKPEQPHIFLTDSLRNLYKQSDAQNYKGQRKLYN